MRSLLLSAIHFMVGSKQRKAFFAVDGSDRAIIDSPKREKRRWERSELALLKREFRYGTQLKVIAKMLGRTESAVNKVLSRTGIRHDLLSATPAIQESGIKQMINYLRQKHYKITFITKINYTRSGVYTETLGYKIDDKPVSCTRLLIIANKLRIEEGLPIFEINADC